MIKYVLTIISMSCALMGAAQKYDVASIPEHLKENANAVIRYQNEEYEIIDATNIKYRYKRVVTILNRDLRRLSDVTIYHDNFREIDQWEARVFDANGVEIKKLKKTDVNDYATSSYAEFSDARVLNIDMSSKKLPYTVEYSYQVTITSLLYLRSWFPVSHYDMSIEKSQFKLSGPVDLFPRYRVRNSALKPSRSEIEGIQTIEISYDNLEAFEYEQFMPRSSEVLPHMEIAPSKINHDGYEGDFSTWKGMGEWQNLVNEGRDNIPEQTRMEVIELTKDATTIEEKIKLVYEYLQGKTRYVSIQLGIGGLQPIPADVVDAKGYGDCKALSNYTKSMLEVIGIKSYYTIIYGGKRPPLIDKSFCKDAFNHIVLCVPVRQDTIWLECTSQTNPFGYQGNFTGDRDALIVTEEGGKIIHTTVYEKEDNTQTRVAQVTLDENGQGKAKIQTKFRGLQYENDGLDFRINESHEEQKKWIQNNTDIPNFELVNFSFDLDKARIPSIDQELELNLPDYGQSSGNRLFIPLNLMNRMTFVPKRLSERKTDVYLGDAFIDTDSIVYDVPESLHPEFAPEPIEFSSEFGEYHSTVTVDNGKVIYVRKFSMHKGSFPKESYDDLRDFFKKVRKADKAKIVFLKST